MPPDEADKLGLLRFLTLTIGLPALFLLLSYLGANYAQSVNRRLANPEARSYFRSWVPIPSIRQRPEFRDYSILRFAVTRYPRSGDPFLFQLTAQLKKENFDLSSTISSSRYFTPDISKATPFAARVASDRQFASLFDFCRDLLSRNAFDDEKAVLKKYWESVVRERNNVDEQDFDNYVHYVVDTYTIPGLLSFKERRVVRAQELLAKACDRLLLVPPSSLEFEGTSSDLLRNVTFIFAGLLDDQVSSALYYEQADKAVTCLINQLPPWSRDDWSKNEAGRNQVIDSFMLGLYLFDECRYQECAAQTAVILRARPNERLTYLVYLMQLRCAWKQQERDGKTRAKSHIDLANAYATLGNSPYASVLHYYKDKLSK
jgi:hypothetical protein